MREHVARILGNESLDHRRARRRPYRPVPRGLPGKRIKSLTGLWTLALYFLLGIVPLLLRH